MLNRHFYRVVLGKYQVDIKSCSASRIYSAFHSAGKRDLDHYSTFEKGLRILSRKKRKIQEALDIAEAKPLSIYLIWSVSLKSGNVPSCYKSSAVTKKIVLQFHPTIDLFPSPLIPSISLNE